MPGFCSYDNKLLMKFNPFLIFLLISTPARRKLQLTPARRNVFVTSG